MIAAALSLVVSAAAQSPVELRGGAAALDARVVRAGAGGLVVSANGAERTLCWSRVRSVTGEGAETAAPRMELAERAWRARIRLERGDCALAEPLLEALLVETRGEVGPTALLTREGLLACRVDRGALVSAVIPWLEAAAQLEEGAADWRLEGEAAVVDRETLLAPALAPLFLKSAALTALGHSSELELLAGEGAPPRARSLAAWTRWGVLRALDEDAPAPGEANGFYAAVVAAQFGEKSAAAPALAALDIAVLEHGGWREAWARSARGRRLAFSEERSEALAGMLDLLHAPARFGDELPHLSSASLALAAAALADRGDAEASERLIGRLRTMAGAVPSLAWLDERGLAATGVSAAARKERP